MASDARTCAHECIGPFQAGLRFFQTWWLLSDSASEDTRAACSTASCLCVGLAPLPHAGRGTANAGRQRFEVSSSGGFSCGVRKQVESQRKRQRTDAEQPTGEHATRTNAAWLKGMIDALQGLLKVETGSCSQSRPTPWTRFAVETDVAPRRNRRPS